MIDKQDWQWLVTVLLTVLQIWLAKKKKPPKRRIPRKKKRK